MARKPRALVACPEFALRRLLPILGERVHVLHAASMEEARRVLATPPGVALVVGAVYFDTERMFDLLRFARETYPAIPFVCCRAIDSGIPQTALEALALEATSDGAACFIDLPSLTRELGEEEGERRFLQLVLRELARPAKA